MNHIDISKGFIDESPYAHLSFIGSKTIKKSRSMNIL